MNKKVIVWIVVCSAFAFLTTALAGAGEHPQASSYRQFIQDKIVQCGKKAETLSGCRSARLQDCSVKTKEQAAFYQNNMETLVQQMIDQNIPLKQYKMSYFLIQAYTRSAGLGKSE